MKVLLDENLPHDLRHYLRHHDTKTASYAGFAGYTNGQLLSVVEEAGFDVLVNGDKKLQYEQNMTGRKIALVTLSAVDWPVIEAHVARIAAAVDDATTGSITRVECGKFTRGQR